MAAGVMTGEKAGGLSHPCRLRNMAVGELEQVNLLGGGAVGCLNGDFWVQILAPR